MNYNKISKHFIEYYGCDSIAFNFLELSSANLVVVLKITFDNGITKVGRTSYSYDELQSISDWGDPVLTGVDSREGNTRVD